MTIKLMPPLDALQEQIGELARKMEKMEKWKGELLGEFSRLSKDMARLLNKPE